MVLSQTISAILIKYVLGMLTYLIVQAKGLGRIITSLSDRA